MSREKDESGGPARLVARALKKWGLTGREPGYPPGYLAARAALEAGRSAFFGWQTSDLPVRNSTVLAEDDLIPHFGFVGRDFQPLRVLLLGINPGNGPANTIARSAGDEKMMPALRRFAELRTPQAFLEAQDVYKDVCCSWPIWRWHCAELLKMAGLSTEQVAYSYCLPWRTASETGFDDWVARKAARLYAIPLVEELKPNVIVAVGRKTAAILGHATTVMPPTVVWNRALMVTVFAERERRAAADQLRPLLDAIRRGQAT